MSFGPRRTFIPSDFGPMHEDLLGYLLGALDAAEQRRIERELAASPQLRFELERLRRSLEPLESLNDEQSPPPDLAHRTVNSIARHDRARDNEAGKPTPRSIVRRLAFGPGIGSNVMRPNHYRVSDNIVLALVGLIAITLFLPALANSRYEARKLTCQNNLRNLAWQLFGYCDRQPDRHYPFVPPYGNHSFAGFYAPVLLESDLIPRDCSYLICPGSELALEQADSLLQETDLGPWRVPSIAEINAASGRRLYRLQNRAGGSYAYCVGYVENGYYYPARNLGRSHYPIVADTPSLYLPGLTSANHAGRGQNICYDDGRVGYVTDLSQFVGDDPWRNDHGFVEVGSNANDSVLLQSWMRPINLDSEPCPQIIVDPRFLR